MKTYRRAIFGGALMMCMAMAAMATTPAPAAHIFIAPHISTPAPVHVSTPAPAHVAPATAPHTVPAATPAAAKSTSSSSKAAVKDAQVTQPTSVTQIYRSPPILTPIRHPAQAASVASASQK